MKFLQATVSKTENDEKTGVSLRTRGQLLMIASIAEGGLFERSAKTAKVGMRVLRINNVSVDGMKTEDAVAIIKETKGDVPFLLVQGSDEELKTIKSDSVHATTAYRTKDDKVKISFQGKKGAVKVTKISPDSPFENTSLQVGNTLLAVNNISVIDMTSEQILDTLTEVKDPITIIASEEALGESKAGGSEGAPHGLPPGGSWGVVKYVGPSTQQLACLGCLCFGLPGCCVLLCPSDEKDVYKVGGRLYHADGKPCPESAAGFIPKRDLMQR